MSKLYVVRDPNETFKEKVERITENAKRDVKIFFKKHGKELIVYGPTVVGLGLSVVTGISRHHRRVQERRDQDLRIYDRSLDIWWDLRRKLSTEQKMVINDRIKTGERLGDVLKDLKVLK